MGKRELIALLNLSSWCPVMVERLFLAVPRGCLQFVIVVFPDHTHFFGLCACLHFRYLSVDKVRFCTCPCKALIALLVLERRYGCACIALIALKALGRRYTMQLGVGLCACLALIAL